MRRFRAFLLILGFLISFPTVSGREELALREMWEKASPAESAFLPDLPIAPPPLPSRSVRRNVSCALSADLSALSQEEKEGVLSATAFLPCKLLQSLDRVEIVADESMPRALAGQTVLKLRSDVFSKAEIIPLLIHEFGHVIDLGGLRGTPGAGESLFLDGSAPVLLDDPSLGFYRISWEDNDIKRRGVTADDFVSGYAQTDPFEDFAESLLFYRLHGRTFARLADGNARLMEKYDFLKEKVFAGEEFSNGSADLNMSPRPWDITKL